ncbi:hypothetical protein ACFE04_008566 [Oxalis oulophora]
MELIEGLNDDVASECLIRVPFDSFSTIASTCELWKAHIHRPEFLLRRKAAALTQPVFVMTQARVNPDNYSAPGKYQPLPVYGLTLHEPDTPAWRELPPVPDYSDGLPLFSRVVGIRSGLVLLGGWHPTNLEVSNAVYIFDFITATWRRGAGMPGVRRSLFGCASDSDKMVYVAGGHDEDKNALKSVLMYDVVNDVWVTLPDMAYERDECKAVFHSGMLHVISGYSTENQGRFEKTGEKLESVSMKWSPVNADSVGSSSTSSRDYVADANGRLYTCHGSNVVVLENDTWQAIAELPVAVGNTAKLMTWKEKLLAIGSETYGGALSAYVMDIKLKTWTQTAMPKEYSGHIHSCCNLEL